MFSTNNRSHKIDRNVRPQFDALEDRVVMTAVPTYNAAAMKLVIRGDNTAEGISVYKSTVGSQQVYGVTSSGVQVGYIPIDSRTPVNSIEVHGGGGNDTIVNATALSMTAYGDAGNDVIYGSSQGDVLWGNDGNDILYGYGGSDIIDGGAGDDNIFGGDGADYLYGSDGSDYLAGEGGGAAVLHGGRGYDMEAGKWAPQGVKKNDVIQAGSPTCWYQASLSSVAGTSLNLVGPDRVQMMDARTYQVKLFNVNSNVWQWNTVAFDGSTHSGDAAKPFAAGWDADNPACEGEFWTILYQRAMLKMQGVNYLDAYTVGTQPFGYATTGLTMLTGQQTVNTAPKMDEWYGWGNNMDVIKTALNAGKPVVASSKSSGVASNIVRSHAYSITAIDTWNKKITIRDPYANSGPGMDGYQTITWAQFCASFAAFATTK